MPSVLLCDRGTSYFGTDILGSVRSVTDKYGTVQSEYNYDAFGSPYLGNLENDIGFGYCSKVYDIGTGLYDYGFRDYSPVSARFTTIDPIRDGSNWFSYVVNDPVNYVDLWGLEVLDVPSILMNSAGNDAYLGNPKRNEKIADVGCTLTMYTRMAAAILGDDAEISLVEANEIANELHLFNNKNELSIDNGVVLMNAILERNGRSERIEFAGSVEKDYTEKYRETSNSENTYFVTARIHTDNSDETEWYDHSLNLNADAAFVDWDTISTENFHLNDTSGVRKNLLNDSSGRTNMLQRMDFFKVIGYDSPVGNVNPIVNITSQNISSNMYFGSSIGNNNTNGSLLNNSILLRGASFGTGGCTK